MGYDLLTLCQKLASPADLVLKPLDTFCKQYFPRPTLRVSQLIYKITNLWKFRLNRSLESGENNRKTHPCFRTIRHVMTCVYYKSVILVVENWYCFIVFSQSKAFHEKIFQEKSFTITFCKLYVNLWTFYFIFSVPKVYNGFKIFFLYCYRKSGGGGCRTTGLLAQNCYRTIILFTRPEPKWKKRLC